MALPDEGERCTIENSSQRSRMFEMSPHQPTRQIEVAKRNDGIVRYHSVEDLIEFQYKLLSTLLQRLINQRSTEKLGHDDTSHLNQRLPRSTSMLLDEITDVVDLEVTHSLPTDEQSDTDNSSILESEDGSFTPLKKEVKDQLRHFVARIASMYHSKNPFHSFHHACHVTFSAYQLLRRVVAKDLPNSPVAGCSFSDPWGYLPSVASDSMVGTTGNILASDALAQFAIIFSALIHDVNHVGVPNAQLAKEQPTVAEKYQHRSLAEQTSVDLTWDLLEEDSFHELKACIFPSRREYKRFRSMVVNMVMSTDISDATLRAFQEQKWEKAFGTISLDRERMNSSASEARKRKATVMMDLIIMASDISHTMQPFDVYCEWNERLFREMYVAFREGRSENDPSKSWCLGEMFFYDKHIIPLAKRLQESSLFGSVADILLENAQRNRELWQNAGQDIFHAMQKRLMESPPEVTPRQEKPPLPTHSNSFIGGLLSICCRRQLPTYLQSEEDDEDYVDEDDVGPSRPKMYYSDSNPCDEETQAESDDDDDGFSTMNNAPSIRFSMGSFYLRSRVKQW